MILQTQILCYLYFQTVLETQANVHAMYRWGEFKKHGEEALKDLRWQPSFSWHENSIEEWSPKNNKGTNFLFFFFNFLVFIYICIYVFIYLFIYLFLYLFIYVRESMHKWGRGWGRESTSSKLCTEHVTPQGTVSQDPEMMAWVEIKSQTHNLTEPSRCLMTFRFLKVTDLLFISLLFYPFVLAMVS